MACAFQYQYSLICWGVALGYNGNVPGQAGGALGYGDSQNVGDNETPGACT
jgi:hypothetical protein